jgi:GntR family transcriptional regulator/MocR family aminotransferase
LEKYVRATLRLYRERQEALIEAIRNEDRGMLEVTAGGTGMYLVAWLNPGVNDDAVARAAVAHDVDVVPLSTFAIKPLVRSGLVLGFSAYEPWQIRAAVKRLCAAMANS